MDIEKLIEDLKVGIRETILQYKDDIIKEAKNEVIKSVAEELQKNQAAFKVYASKIDNLRATVEEVKSKNQELVATFEIEMNKLKNALKDVVNKVSELKVRTDTFATLKTEIENIILTTTAFKQQMIEIVKRIEQIEKKQESLATQVMVAVASSNAEVSKLAQKISQVEADISDVSSKANSLVKQNETLMKIIEEINKMVVENYV